MYLPLLIVSLGCHFSNVPLIPTDGFHLRVPILLFRKLQSVEYVPTSPLQSFTGVLALVHASNTCPTGEADDALAKLSNDDQNPIHIFLLYIKLVSSSIEKVNLRFVPTGKEDSRTSP